MPRRRSIFDRGDWVWVPDAAEAWVPARITKRHGGKVTTETADGDHVKWSEAEAEKFEECGPLNDEHANLVELEEFSEGSILHQIRMRFANDKIYTFVGSILVAVNPFKWLPIYSDELMLRYRASAAAADEAEPHVFATAARAYQDLVDSAQSQSVLISGESGAGKTETTKKVLSYMTHVAGGTSNVADQILQSNPVLEAFGNAKTLRNNNSSRFGKWMQIDFDGGFKIVGCSIVNYLLEKSRVVGQNPDERNYHVFYMLLEGTTPSEKIDFHLQPPEAYAYLNSSGCYAVDGWNDVEEWAAMTAAFQTLQFSADEVRDIKVLLAAILNLGNIRFEQGRKEDSSAVANADDLANVAALLSVDAQALQQALCFRRRQMGRGSMVMIDLSPDKAAAGRDALSKALYGTMFDWLVKRVNDTLFRGPTPQHLGVLDIFGFEVFDVNSFEQLCINYANEKLQSHFNDCIFEMEMQLYRDENVPYDEITFQDNHACIELVEGKPIGLISLLDEECSLGKGSDATYLNKCTQNFKTSRQSQNPHFEFTPRKPDQFGVRHFAGTVTYTVSGFLDKNRDTLDPVLGQCMGSSRNQLVSLLFAPPPAAAGARKGKKTLKSIGSKFHSQLVRLMDTLHATQPHFIRCIKPNGSKAAMMFEGSLSLRQLKYAGLFEAIRIRKAGYAYRIPHAAFLHRHGWMFPAVKATRHSNPHSACLTLMESMTSEQVLEARGWAVGATRVFLRDASDRQKLEKHRMARVAGLVVSMQALVRGFLARNRITGTRRVGTKARASRDKAASRIQRMVRGWRTRRWFHRARIVLQFRAAVASRHPGKIRSYLEAVRHLPASIIPRREVEGAQAVLDELEGEEALLREVRMAVHARDVAGTRRLVAGLGRSALGFHDVVLAAKQWVAAQERRDQLEQDLADFVRQGPQMGTDPTSLLDRAAESGADPELLEMARQRLADSAPELHARRTLRLGVETANPNLIRAGIAELEEHAAMRGHALADVEAGRNMLRMLAFESELVGDVQEHMPPSVFEACEAVAAAVGPDEKTRAKAALRGLVGTRDALARAVRTYKWIKLYATWRKSEEDRRDDRSFFGFTPPSEMPDVGTPHPEGAAAPPPKNSRNKVSALKTHSPSLARQGRERAFGQSARMPLGPQHRPQTTQERTRLAAVPRQARKKKVQVWGERTDFIQARLEASRAALKAKERQLQQTRAVMEVNGTQGRNWRP